MLKKVNKFNYMLPLNQDKGLWDAEKDHIMKSGTMVNKGGVKTGELMRIYLLSLMVDAYILSYHKISGQISSS